MVTLLMAAQTGTPGPILEETSGVLWANLLIFVAVAGAVLTILWRVTRFVISARH